MELEVEVQKDINKIVEELRNTKRLSKAYEFLLWLDDIEKLAEYNDFNIVYPSDYDEVKSKFNSDKYADEIKDYCVNTKLEMFDIDKKICKISPYFEKKYQFSNQIVFHKAVSIEDSIMLCEEFLKYYDKDIYELYNKLNDEGRYFLAKLEGARGITLCGNKVAKPYVLLSVDTCANQFIEQIFVLVHETIHAYIASIQGNLKKAESFRLYANNLEEVYSLFSELAVAEYLEGIGFNKRDVKAYRLAHLSDLIGYLKDFKKSHYLDVIEDAYSYGHVLAYHFYDQYLKNKDLAKKNVTNFMIDSAYYNKRYMLNNYGLDERDILSPEIIEKHTHKYLKRVPK